MIFKLFGFEIPFDFGHYNGKCWKCFTWICAKGKQHFDCLFWQQKPHFAKICGVVAT